jgi:hypothetical protein
MLEKVPTYFYLSIFLFSYISILVFIEEEMATYLWGDGNLSKRRWRLIIYLRGDGNLSTYLGGGAYLSIFIFISIYLNLSFYLSRRRWPPIYGGEGQPI